MRFKSYRYHAEPTSEYSTLKGRFSVFDGLEELAVFKYSADADAFLKSLQDKEVRPVLLRIEE